MSIKIEIPADDKLAARVFGQALIDYAGAKALPLTDDDHEALKEYSESKPDAPLDTSEPKGAPSVFGDDEPATETETTDSRVDHHGVPFNDQFCGNSAEPFYASGKQRGQWKKKRGVDEAAYDAWYKAELAKQSGGASEPEQEIDAAGAFGGQTAAPEPELITDAGVLMGFLSEKQTSGELTPDQIDAVWAEAQCGVQDIFPSGNADVDAKIPENVKRVHGIALSKLGAR